MKDSKIEWTHHTFNPWIGCTKVSDGCKHCYAEALMDTRWGKVEWGPQGTRQRTSDSYWRQPLTWDKAAAKAGTRARVFCASLADVFEERTELAPWRADLLALIEQTRNLDWLLLTKRPENVNRLIEQSTGRHAHAWLADCRHVWVGTSVENQDAAEKRIPALLRVPAKVRFLSCEPLLGPVDLSGRTMDTVWIDQEYARQDYALANLVRDEGWPIHWVIVGGESGPNARPMHPDWARSLRDQCIAACVPFLFKQWGEWLPDKKGLYGARSQIFGNTVVHAVGKKRAGRVLDEREWNEFPATK